jgi:phosphatidylglycerophosphate synthase
MNQSNLFTSSEIDERRKILLPLWIKVFCWIFLILSVGTLITAILDLTGFAIPLTLYGLETQYPLSWVGLIIICLFVFKGIVSFGLLKGKEWSIDLAQTDAITGIIICIIMMIIHPLTDDFPGFRLTFRLELLILIPYLAQLRKISYYWTYPE